MNKYLVGFFAIEFVILMLFYGYAYPIIPFWGDDWQYLAESQSLKPKWGAWIAGRILQTYLQTGLGVVANYVVMPLGNLGFFDAIAITCAIFASFALLIVHIMLFKVCLLITQSQSSAFMASSVFVLGAFIATKANVMPLLYPVDLKAEGMGYVLTTLCSYLLPYLLNLILFGMILYVQFSHKKIFDLNNKNIIMAMGGGIAIYLSQFSITTASLILSSYAGILLLSKRLEKRNLGKLRDVFYHWSVFEYVLLGIVILWIVAAIFDLGSGRAEYCGSFDLSAGVAYTKDSFNNLREGFYILFSLAFLVTLCCMIRDYRKRQNRIFVLFFVLSIFYLVIMTILYTLVVSKCGAKFYLMSGLFLSMLFVLSIWVAILCVRGRIFVALTALMMIISLLHPFTPYIERPRAAYHYYKSFSQSWINQVKEAESLGKNEVIIEIPKALPHWQWEGWFFSSFERTLKRYGIIRSDIKIRFVPQDEK